MDEIATIPFIDQESRDDGVAIVRCSDGIVALALSLRSDGDIEIVVRVEQIEPLLDALNAAVQRARTGG